jgi:diacylglycerol kinase (ATP)
MAERATIEGRQLVIACGGDGTLNEVVNGLAGQQNGHRVPMALLPAGTANVLAKELGLPWDIPSAAAKLVHGEIKYCAWPGHSAEGARQKALFFERRRGRP